MTQVLSNDQINQVVRNTMVVMLARPDLLPDWQANLLNLLHQTRAAQLDDEMYFVAAILTLLHTPGDTLPTGTIYDHAWRALLAALQTGVVQPVGEDGETVTVERLLQSVAQAVVKVLNDAPDQAARLAEEVREMRGAAVEAEIADLVRWLDDVLALLAGQSPGEIAAQHADIYDEYWRTILDNTDRA